MLFQDEHITAIREGVKTVTRRDWANGYNRPNPGVHMATTSLSSPTRSVHVISSSRTSIANRSARWPRRTTARKGGYGRADFEQAWRDINGEELDPEKVVDVVEFEYGGRTRETAREKARKLGVEVADGR